MNQYFGKSGFDETIGLDPCAHKSAQIARVAWGPEENGLQREWTGCGTVFVNPPFSAIHDWMKKLSESMKAENGPVLGLALVPSCCLHTSWCIELITAHAYAVLMKNVSCHTEVSSSAGSSGEDSDSGARPGKRVRVAAPHSCILIVMVNEHVAGEEKVQYWSLLAKVFAEVATVLEPAKCVQGND